MSKKTLRVLMATSDADVVTMKKAAKTGKPPMYFSLPKDSNKGGAKDDAVIFTHEGLFAYAKILTKPDPEQLFGKRPVWRARVGAIQLIDPVVKNDEVNKEILDWRWPSHPRRSFCTPTEEHAEQLRTLVNKKLGKQVAAVDKASIDDQDKLSPKSGAGYETEKARRDACENHAMIKAETHYKKKGFDVESTSKTQSYDLLCTKGKLRVHVEVKGTTSDGSEVELTIGEVENAAGKGWRTDLFVVSNIKLTKNGRGEIVTSGGVEHPFENWAPDEKDLRAIRFRYKVPMKRRSQK